MSRDSPRQSKLPAPALLVSVRSVEEAAEALAGGADVIDIKEPENGPLGAAKISKITRIVELVGNKRTVTVACGELIELPASWPPATPGVSMVKVGLARLHRRQEVQARLAEAFERCGSALSLVPVAYADHERATAPPPADAIAASARVGARWVMVDTFSKANGGLFNSLAESEIAALVGSAHGAGMRIALSGSLDAEKASLALRLGADMVGVRGAACPSGRLGRVCREAVHSLVVACMDGSRSHCSEDASAAMLR